MTPTKLAIAAFVALSCLPAFAQVNVGAAAENCKEYGGSYDCTTPVRTKVWMTPLNPHFSSATYGASGGGIVDPACLDIKLAEVRAKALTPNDSVDAAFVRQSEIYAACNYDQIGMGIMSRVGDANYAPETMFLQWYINNMGTNQITHRPGFRKNASYQLYFPTLNAYYTQPHYLVGTLDYLRCPVGLVLGENTLPDPLVCIAANPTPEIGRVGCPKLVGNPINTGSGNKFQEEVDFSHSRGLLSFVRVYNSTGGPLNHDVGSTWRHSFNMSIELRTGSVKTVANVHRPDGGMVVFDQSALNGNFYAQNVSPNRLVALKDGSGIVTGYRFSDGKRFEVYNADGLIQKIVNPDGYAVTMTYSNGLLSSVTDSFNAVLSFVRDPATTNIITVIDPAGGSVGYSYDGNGNITGVTYQDGKSKSYLYSETLNLLTGIVDENGKRFATYTYMDSDYEDIATRGVSTEHAGGVNKFSIDYTNYPYQVVVTDPLGTQSTKNFATMNGVSYPTTSTQAAGSGCGAATSSIGYNSNGTVNGKDDFKGNRTCFGSDASGLEYLRVEGASIYQSCLTSLNSAAAGVTRKTFMAWNPTFAMMEQASAPFKKSTFVYNGRPDPFNGNAIANCMASASPLPNGQAPLVLCKSVEQATTDANGNSGTGAAPDATVAARVTSYTYNSAGQVLTSTDADGKVSSNTYYSDTTQFHSVGDLATSTNPVGHVKTFTKYDRNNVLIEAVDERGVTTSSVFDPRGRVISTTVLGRVTSIVRDDVGSVLSVTNPDGSVLSYTYDDAHRMVTSTDQFGNVTTYTLDNGGNRVLEVLKNPSGVVLHTTKRTFDALGRLSDVVGDKS